VWNLLVYQQKIKKILYELFILKHPLKGVALRWGIPPEMLSRFRKSFVSQVFQQNSELIEQKVKDLPRGVMLADETFMGDRGNSNVKIVVINNNFEVLSTGPAYFCNAYPYGQILFRIYHPATTFPTKYRCHFSPPFSLDIKI